VTLFDTSENILQDMSVSTALLCKSYVCMWGVHTFCE